MQKANTTSALDPATLVLATKLQLPQIKHDTLYRDRLIGLVINNLDRKLIVITGDAGYGKTTLLAQVKHKAHLPGVFISLEPSDSDLATYFSYMVSGLEQLQPGLAKRCQVLVDRGTDIGKNYRLAMGTLLNELVEKRNEEMFIFLDDYHTLPDDSDVHQALDYFIDHLPTIVHVVIASRKVPPLPSLAKWRAKRDLAELGREALRFTEEEIRALLGQFYNVSLSDEELQGIIRRTEGWITGIQLILQAAGRDGRTVRETLNSYLEEHGDLFRYFAGEIFNREKEVLRDFLRRSSVLDNMTPAACRSILQIKESAEYLDDLAKNNLFVMSVGTGVFRYHRLFREFLYDQLTDSAERNALHTRAAEYHEKNGESAKAIDQYLSAGQYPEAIRLIGRERERMNNRAQFSVLSSWLDRLPAATFDDNPWLYAVRAILCKEQGKLEQAEVFYQQAEKLLRAQGNKDASWANILYEKSIILHRKGESKEALAALQRALKCCSLENNDLKIAILGFTAVVWIQGFGEHKKARRYMEQARRLLKYAPESTQRIPTEQKQAFLLESAGEKRGAFKLYKSIIEQIDTHYFYQAGSYFNNAARLAMLMGQTDWAEKCLKKGQALCRGYEDVFSESMLENGLGSLYLFKGQWEPAQKYLERSLNIYKEMNWTRSVCVVLNHLSRLYRYRGEYDMAERYIDQMKQQTTSPPDQTMALLEQSLIETARGHYENGLRTLEYCQENTIKYFGRMGEIYCYLAKANIQAGLGKKRDAMKWLRKALVLAKDYSCDGMLACELRASETLRGLAKQCIAERTYLLSIPPYDRVAEPATKTSLRVELLGPPRLLFGDREITDGFRHKVLQLLCFLAYHGEQGTTRDEIVQALWPKVKPKPAVDNFHFVLFEVRHKLSKAVGKPAGKVVIKTGGRYRINGGLPVTVDAHTFEALLAQSVESERNGDPAAAKKTLIKALGMKRGDSCSGWTENWALELSRRYEDLYQKALLRLGAMHFREGDLESSRECYDLAVKRDELCEEGYRGLIRLYGAQGRLQEATVVFNRLQNLLRRELKEAPSPETIGLYQSIIPDNA